MRAALLIAVMTLLAGIAGAAELSRDEMTVARKVYTAKCAKCHGDKVRKAALRAQSKSPGGTGRPAAWANLRASGSNESDVTQTRARSGWRRWLGSS